MITHEQLIEAGWRVDDGYLPETAYEKGRYCFWFPGKSFICGDYEQRAETLEELQHWEFCYRPKP